MEKYLYAGNLVKRKKVTQQKSGHILSQNNSKNTGEIALFINKKVKHMVTTYKTVSNRVNIHSIQLTNLQAEKLNTYQ